MSVCYKRDIPQTILPKNKTSAIPNRFIVFDTETFPTETDTGEFHSLRMAWVCLCERRKVTDKWTETYTLFKSGKLLWDYVQSLAWDKKPIYIFAHNAFFDLTSSSFFPYFTYRGWKRTFWYDKGLTYLFFIKKGLKTLKVVSTTNYFPSSVAEMGKAIGIEKIDLNPLTAGESETETYCRRDVEIVVKYLQRYMVFIAESDLGRFAVTRASQAMNAYRHRFMSTQIYLHKDDEARELECYAYFGGRTECFQLGKIKGGPFTTLDINSMYPWAMKAYPSPTKLRAVLHDVPITKLRDLLTRFACIAKVQLKTDIPIYAVRSKDKVVFPIGTFITGLCTGGLREALKRKHIVQIISLAYYDQEHIFNDYVDYFYGMRNDAKASNDKLQDTYAKYCLNSLYGKFGQYQPVIESEDCPDNMDYSRHEIYDVPNNKTIVVTKCMNVTSVENGRTYAEKSLYAIPAHITEYARLLLWSIIEKAGTDKVLYCDTDSIKIRKRDLSLIKHPISQTTLGALKIEHTTDVLTLFGLKDYVDGDETKIKGVPKRSIKNADGSYTYQSWLKQPSHLRLKESDRYIIHNVTKRLSRQYTKGRIAKDGRILPLIYSET